MTYSAICSIDPTSNRDQNIPNSELSMVHLLEEAAKACNIDTKASTDKWLSSARRELPSSEFERPDFCLAGAFPHVFLYGKAYYRDRTNDPAILENTTTSNKKRAYMTRTDCNRHLLFQFTNAAATTRELLLYMHNQQQRHSVIRGMFAKV